MSIDFPKKLIFELITEYMRMDQESNFFSFCNIDFVLYILRKPTSCMYIYCVVYISRKPTNGIYISSDDEKFTTN